MELEKEDRRNKISRFECTDSHTNIENTWALQLKENFNVFDTAQY